MSLSRARRGRDGLEVARRGCNGLEVAWPGCDDVEVARSGSWNSQKEDWGGQPKSY